ncbi:DUF1697 domain-containing protein [Nocardia wallacei]|uniref:DUF1697 domain-containing protein n=1 Tax=Nocardia wallacei TaxID=480035 RepID=UPI002453FD92|nr:DUF1697 domain-containing protein [Nocardia wallacei]
MNRYAALLRGIMPSNPNMRNEKLRSVFEGLGFEAVGSVLSSGNVVFGSPESDAAALESRIQKALNAELGIGGGTILRSRAELRALVDSDPFPGLTHGRGTYLTVTFLKDRAAAAPAALPAGLAPAVRIVGYDEAAAAVGAGRAKNPRPPPPPQAGGGKRERDGKNNPKKNKGKKKKPQPPGPKENNPKNP